MEKINKVLLMLIAMGGIMIAAVGLDKGIQAYDNWKWDSERLVRMEQARADVENMQMTISELARDQEALERFIEENSAFFDETGSQPENLLPAAGDHVQVEASEGIPEDNRQTDVSGNGQEDISGNQQDETPDGGQTDVSGNLQTDVSGNRQVDISGNMQGSISGNQQIDVSGNIPESVSGNTLQEKRQIRGSYMETRMQNVIDKKIIAESSMDFSGLTIACLGDSITEASNLDGMEGYQRYSYPEKLGEILMAERVTNLGIGGSSIGRYWADPFVERYTDIPADTDLIIVMGGTNDGFCLSQKELGSMDERKANTFIGDLDELMRGLKENYPQAKIVFATPLPNVLHDMLRKEREYLLPQRVLADAIRELAAEYDISVIDLYNSNILDTHDAAVIYNYMPDGVHCNSDGYTVLAEHFAAELIKLYEQAQQAQEFREQGE